MPQRVQLNGQVLGLGAGDELPALRAQRIPAEHAEHAPASITFLVGRDAVNGNCR